MSEQKKTLGMAMSGGGARAAFHIGFYRALEENNIKVDFVSGCSMGALVAVGIALGKTSYEIETEFKKLENIKFTSLKNFNFFRSSLFTANPIQKSLEKIFADMKIEDLKIPFACTCIDLESREEVVLNEGSVVEALMATTAFPTLFPPRYYKNAYLVDGGVVDNVPCRLVRNMGAETLIVLKLRNNAVRQRIAGQVYLHNIKKKKFSFLYLFQNLKLLTDIFYDTIDIASEHNTLKNIEFSDPNLTIDQNLTYELLDFSKVSEIVEIGYKSGLSEVSKIKKFIK